MVEVYVTVFFAFFKVNDGVFKFIRESMLGLSTSVFVDDERRSFFQNPLFQPYYLAFTEV